ncbi:hypothetical protein V495_08158, partial [Pseudogymnoascus sp. VKM F-4514 (FW-929)]
GWVEGVSVDPDVFGDGGVGGLGGGADGGEEFFGERHFGWSGGGGEGEKVVVKKETAMFEPARCS